MVDVKIFRDESNFIKAFKISGHANYAANGQLDLVCGVVSGLSLTAVNGLIEYLKLNLPEIKVEEGLMYCQLPTALEGKVRDQAEAILETMVIGLEQIAKDFPKYVRIV